MKNISWIKKLIYTLICIAFILVTYNLQVLASEEELLVEHYEQAVVIKDFGIKSIENSAGFTGAEQMLEVEFISGPYKGNKIMVANGLSGMEGMDINVQEGSKVVICYFEDQNTTFPDNIQQAYVSDVVRTGYLKLLVFIFALLMVMVPSILLKRV